MTDEVRELEKILRGHFLHLYHPLTRGSLPHQQRDRLPLRRLPDVQERYYALVHASGSSAILQGTAINREEARAARSRSSSSHEIRVFAGPYHANFLILIERLRPPRGLLQIPAVLQRIHTPIADPSTSFSTRSVCTARRPSSPLHPKHPLTLVCKVCDACSKFIPEHRFYRCHACEIDFHLGCVSSATLTSDHELQHGCNGDQCSPSVWDADYRSTGDKVTNKQP